MSLNAAMMAAVRQQVAGGGEPVLWTPANLTTLEVWLDAQDTASTTAPVSQWNDLSGNANHAVQAVSAYQPLDTGTINGYSSLTFDGSNDYMTLTNVLPSGGFTFVMVYAMPVPGAAGLAGYVGTDIIRAYTGSTTTPITKIDGNTNETGHKTLFDGEPSQTVTNIGNTFTALESTSMVIFSATETPDAAVLEIGRAGATASWNINGDVGEVLIFSEDMSLANKKKIQGYAAHRWNFVADLPVDHPYKDGAPTV